MKDTNPKDSVASNKVPLGLCSPVAKAYWALALQSGAVKYGANNYLVCGARAMVYAHAAMRHLDRWMSGEERDPVDGTHHLGNVMACMSILLDCQHIGNLVDDRPPSMDLEFLYLDTEDVMEELAGKYADKNPRHYTIADSTSENEPLCECDTPCFFCEEPAPETERPVYAASNEPAYKAGDKVEVCWPVEWGDDVWKAGEITKYSNATGEYDPKTDACYEVNVQGVSYCLWFSEYEMRPAKPERAFKVGDRVRAKDKVEGGLAGRAGVVKEDDGDPEDAMPYYVTFGSRGYNDAAWMCAQELEPATLELRIGAKVKCIAGHGFDAHGLTGTVIAARHDHNPKGTWWVEFPTVMSFYYPGELEVVG